MRSILLLLCLPAVGTACLCRVTPVCSRIGPQSVIFAGTVVANHEAAPSHRTVRFSVEEAFAGVGTDAQVEVGTAADGDACGFVFVTCTTWLVFAGRLKDGRIETSLCMGSETLASVAADLSFLRQWKAGKTPTLIQGQLIPDSIPGSPAHSRMMAKMASYIPSAELHQPHVNDDGHGHAQDNHQRHQKTDALENRPPFRSTTLNIGKIDGNGTHAVVWH